MRDHLKDIRAGSVTKTNVIGIRKAINADWRRAHCYSTSTTAPNVGPDEIATILAALATYKPRVDSVLHKSGVARLRDRRYRKRLEAFADMIDRIQEFRLVGYHTELDPSGLHAYPTYRAVTDQGEWFEYFHKPWQAGGDGPRITGYGKA